MLPYKINIGVNDLENALNPNVWPMGIMVREWVHHDRMFYNQHNLQNASPLSREGTGGKRNMTLLDHNRIVSTNKDNVGIHNSKAFGFSTQNKYAPLGNENMGNLIYLA